MIPSRVSIERDPTNKQLEDALLTQMSSIIKQSQPQEKNNTIASDVQPVSVEDAIKELLTLETK